MSEREFDYVVVGAGSAGCVVAARLSENPAVEVALIEAGPDDAQPVFSVPNRFWQQQKSTFDWDFQTEPEPGLGGRRSYLPRGRVVGGTSSMNTMLYVRGDASDYDDWARSGLDGWSFEDVLPLFRRSEDNGRGESRYHGIGGPLAVSDVASVPTLLDQWVAAANEAGHPLNDDFNGPSQEGAGIYQATQRDGVRSSSSTAFLRGSRGRPNLSLLTSTQALRLIFSGSRAVGVEVEADGELRTIRFGEEAILCAGAYQSPQLLMLSGVGPATHLRELGIEVLLDHPGVGADLQDHPGCFLTYPTRIGDDSEGDGWIEAGLFARTRPELPRADVQFHAAAGSFGDEGVSMAGTRALSFGPYVSRPASRGRVWLRSALPQAKPRIVHGFLTAESDLAVLREGVRMAIEIARRPSFREVLAEDPLAAGVGGLPESDTDEAIDGYVRATAFSFYHPSGTCAMGTVVDAEMRVAGLERVRVCDASILPSLIGGNTNAPAIMFGEKLAALLSDSEVPTGPGVGGREATPLRKEAP